MRLLSKYTIILFFFLLPLIYTTVSYAQFVEEIDTWRDIYEISQSTPLEIDLEDEHILELSIRARAVVTNNKFKYWDINIYMNVFKMERSFYQELRNRPANKVFVSAYNEIYVKLNNEKPIDITTLMKKRSNFTLFDLPKDDKYEPIDLIKRFSTLNKLQFRFYRMSYPAEGKEYFEINLTNKDLEIFEKFLEELKRVENQYFNN